MGILLLPFVAGAALVALEGRFDWVSHVADAAIRLGQTFGGPAALLSAGALIYLSVSVKSQLEEARFNREVAERHLHITIMQMAATDDELAAAVLPDASSNNARLVIYANLLVSHWRTMFDVGTISQGQLADMAERAFRSQAMRDYWSIASNHRATYDKAQREPKSPFGQDFNSTLDSIYEQCEHRSVVQAPPDGGVWPARRFAGLGCAVAAVYVLGRFRRNRSV